MDAEKELNIKRVFLTQLSMPWVLLFQEPIVMVISIYMAIIYVGQPFLLCNRLQRPSANQTCRCRVLYTCFSLPTLS